LSCLKCSEECSECNGPSNLFCMDRCSYSYIKIANSSADKVFKCVSCQDITSENEKYQSSFNDKKEYCDEVCGDGFNMGINECDDGNLINKDGCSSTCRVERGYKCRGGSPSQKDLCQKILPISGDITMKIES
jgi:cysteine-rich repeat protein